MLYFTIALSYIVIGWVVCAVDTLIRNSIKQHIYENYQVAIVLGWPLYLLSLAGLCIVSVISRIIYFPIQLINKVLDKEKSNEKL